MQHYANPHKPSNFGDPIVVQCLNGDGTDEAAVSLLAKRTEKFITLGKHNPKAQVDILRETIGAMCKILTTNELFGV
ncbi:Hypothetical protein NGAL_HAMBI1145_40530 [Neorhizobium galegae bv. officinalis]|uniref:Uncharacterized protein n=1 Tax=Neorhizobium galegae bv. officinalis TaxID=323656 RepID=A0A0T7FS31_NEOGA|nr:Hypothetical protein NGAL_HAMBI1145_40530 [Neorhizobium galegae bv. officinalis]